MTELPVFDHGDGPIAIPRCPRCGSTGPHCLTSHTKTPAAAWHLAREDAVARVCGCARCAAWLANRTSPSKGGVN